MGVGVRVLPMTEDEVSTRVEIPGGRVLHYEEYLVRHGALPTVRRLICDGADRAAPAPGVALLASVDVPATAAGVAGLYRDLADRFVLDSADADQVDAVAALGVRPVVAATLLHRGAATIDLVDAVLGAAR